MIQFTPAALVEVDRLRRRQANPDDYLRLQIKSGGCQGQSYDFTFVSHPSPGDYLVSGGIAIAGEHLTTLQGLAVDYAEDLMGGNFRFDNPQATENCGCGASFRTIDRTHSIDLLTAHAAPT
jgi:iron-sulfur cluster assembly protein